MIMVKNTAEENARQMLAEYENEDSGGLKSDAPDEVKKAIEKGKKIREVS